MKIFKKRKILTTSLITFVLLLTFNSFLPLFPYTKDNIPIFPTDSSPKPKNPGNIINPIDNGELDLGTLSEEYNPPAYMGTGPSYSVTETFNEIVKYGTSQSGLKYGTVVNIDLDDVDLYPSQNANKIQVGLTTLIEDHPNAFYNQFTSGWENWTAYETGPPADLSRMTETQTSGIVRLTMDGIKDPLSWTMNDDDGFDADMNSGLNEWVFSESSTSDTGDHSTGSRNYGYRTWSTTNYWFYLHEDGYTTQENHDTWCGYDTVEHADSDTHNFYITSPNFQHGLDTSLGGGYEFTGATLTTRWNVHSSDYNDGSNAGYLDVLLSTNGGSSYTSHRIWTRTGNNPSGWYTDNWDVTSLLNGTSATSNLKIQYHFYVYLYASNSGDAEYLECDIDYSYLYLDYNQARQFTLGSAAGLTSDIYEYQKDTIDANFTFSYKIPQIWDDSGAAGKAACDHSEVVLYMSSTATNPSGADVWTHSLDDDILFEKVDAWRTISDQIIPLESALGQFGPVTSFYFRLMVRWTDNWGPLTDYDLDVELDNLKFEFTANVRPDEVGLVLRDTVQGDLSVSSPGFGTGTYDSGAAWSWTGTYNGGSEPTLQWVITDPYCRGSTNIIIGYGNILMTESDTMSATTGFSCTANATNNWYLSWTSTQKRSDSRTSSEQMDITGVPNDWGASYVSINPSSHSEVASRPAAGTLRVTNSHSTTAYIFTASSPNKLYEQILNIRNQENSTGTFIDTKVVYPDNFTRLRVRASDNNGYLNMTIMNASRIGPDITGSFGIEHHQNFGIGTSDTYSTPWQIPITAIPGKWIYVLWWNNSLTPGQITQVGHATISIDVRRRTVTTGVIFGKQIAGVIGPGNNSRNAINRTLDSDPFSINITWTDLHWGSAVTYCEKAYVNISGDSGPPYDDRPPYTIVQKDMSRVGSTFFYEISPADYATWCYTGSHDFTIVLESESTEIDGPGNIPTRIITGTFYVITNIELKIDATSSLTEPPSSPMQGDVINLRVTVRDLSHSIDVDNSSPYINLLPNPWCELVRANWSLVFPVQYDMFSPGGAPIPGVNGSIPMIVGGYYGTSITLHSSCVAVTGASAFPNNYYYFNFTVELLKNESLDWEAEVTFCKNNTPSPDPEPYRMPNWGRLEVEEALNVWDTLGEGGRNNSVDNKFDIGTITNPIDYFWWDYEKDYQLLYVHFYNVTKGVHGGFVNSTEYNGTGSGTPLEYEGNATYLRRTWDNPYGDIKITSRTTGGFGGVVNDWKEAIPRWSGDSADIRYAKVPEIIKIGPATWDYTGDLTDWDSSNNLTWGWYYRNFTIHQNVPKDYIMSIQCEKRDQYWENETAETSGSGPMWKWRDAIINIIIVVKPNPINFVVTDNSLIARGLPDRYNYYWGDILTLNLTAWDVLNNHTDPVNGIPVENMTTYFRLYQQGNATQKVFGYIPNRTWNSGIYNSTMNTSILNNEVEMFYFQIYGNKANHTVFHQGFTGNNYLTYYFQLKARPTDISTGIIHGVFESHKSTEDILELKNPNPFEFGRTYYIPVNRTFNVSIRYVDQSPRNPGPINDAESFINITDVTRTTQYLVQIPREDNTGINGYYNFTLNTSGLLLKETYKFTFTAQKEITGSNNYEKYTFWENIKDINVKIMPIPIVMEQSYLLGANYFPTQGQKVRVVVKVSDPTTGDLMSGALIWYTLMGPDINPFLPIQGPMIETSPGYYIFELDTWTGYFDWRPGGTYVFEAKVMGFAGDSEGYYGTYEDYRSAMFATSDNTGIFINVSSYGPFGPMTASLLIGLVGAIVVGGAFSTFKTIRLLTVPYALRKIDDSAKKIKRRRKTYAGIMKSREQQIVEEAEGKLSMFGIKLEPISPKKLPPPITKIVKEKEVEKAIPALTEEQIKQELDAIPDLTTEEKALFLKEIKGLSPSDQREFIAGLKGESKEDQTKKP